MALPIFGNIYWAVNPLYPGVTPISSTHYDEVVTYVDLVELAADDHAADDSYTAHGPVNLLESGFMTEDIYKRINAIEDAIEGVAEALYNRLPLGTILLWDGKKEEIPDGWVLCDGNNFTPNLVGKMVLGGSTATTYPLHSENATGTAANLASLFDASKLTSHTHSYFNAYYCENATHSSFVTDTSLGKTYGSNDSDWDNSLAYVNAYTDYAGTTVTTSTFSGVMPPYIKTYFIMQSYGSGTIKVTVHPSSSGKGYVTINGTRVDSTATYTRGTRLNIVYVVPDSQEVTKYTLNGKSIDLNISRVAIEDMDIVCENVTKQCNVKVIQPANGATAINGTVTTDVTYPYGTVVTATTTPNEDYLVGGYVITYRGYTKKVSAETVATYGLNRAIEMAISEVE